MSCCGALVLWVTFGRGPEIEIQELVAAHRQNALPAKSFRMAWSLTRHAGMGRKRLWEAEIERARQLGDLKRITHLEALLARPDEVTRTVVQQEFWTDGDHFQVRFPIDERGSPELLESVWSWTALPREFPSPEHLAEHYDRVLLVSFGPATNHQYRIWTGMTLKNYHSALIQSGAPPHLLDWPPLTRPARDWGGRIHLLDEFFGTNPVGERWLGRAELEGHPVEVYVRAFKKLPSGVRALVGYFDLRRPVWPIRVEVYGYGPSEVLSDDFVVPMPWGERSMQRPYGHPFEVVDAVEFDDEGGLIYPVRGRYRHFQPLELRDQGEVIVREERNWEIRELEIVEPPAREFFALEFPASTIVNDQTQGAIRISSGTTDDVAEELVGRLPSSPGVTRGWASDVMLWVGALGVGILGLLAWRGWSRRSR